MNNPNNPTRLDLAPAIPTTVDGSDNPPISLHEVTFGYDADCPVVRQVTGSLTAGRIAAVIGPNAAGKTTLVKLMLGELNPTEGQVLLAGRPVETYRASERARAIAYVPQRGGVQFAFTVRQVIEMGRFAHRDRIGVEQAIEQCDLSAVMDRPFAHLSGGQQQRVLLARAIAQLQGAGQVLLADEPGSSMDLRHQLRMMKMLRSIADAGVAVLIVIHDLNLAARYADDVWLMREGELMACGTWSQVIQPPLLEEAYGVQLTVVAQTKEGRPVLAMDEAGTMDIASSGQTGAEQ